MKTYLAKHGVYCPTSSIQPAKKGPDIRCFMGGKQSLTHQEVLERRRLWILALWINRSPQRRQKWKEICKLNSLPDKFVAYDVTTRRNSTFRMVDDGLKSR
ncbi:hypothetical protein N7495_005310 [Penicillium taxi]|uniref:uncharacterized protein n=1 Tax=Penicillium taxi TaxID=168475 RepID=UPI0025454531|nr:uncharacterized protein N7495_005310 [Penicillium taxi]KAJ5893619.1 hypothetical protein N7495_005310 [Penicillium taxi]